MKLLYTKAKEQNYYLVALFILSIFCLVYRLSFVLDTNFPLRDGGFFYVLIKDLQANHYSLPFFSTFNQDSIPYTYPPFAFYLTGFVSDLFHIDILALLRFLPAIFSSFCIPAFWLLAKSILSTEKKAFFATFIYAFLPLSNIWLIAGGGITRSVGELFCILSLYFLVDSLKNAGRKSIWLAALFSGLTVLSHPEASFFLAYSVLIFLIFYGRGFSWKKLFVDALIIGGGALLVSSPWWGINIARHGMAIIQPLFDSGFSQFIGVFNIFFLNFTSEQTLTILAALGVAGIIISISKKDYSLLVWLIVPFILQSRAANQRVTLPIALAAGECADWLFNYFFESNHFSKRIALIITSFFFIFVVASTTITIIISDTKFDPQLITAIDWLKTRNNAENVLVVQPNGWVNDSLTEWVAALSGHHASVEVQGYEWKSGFSERAKQHAALTECLGEGVECIVHWCDSTDSKWVFVPVDSSTGAFAATGGIIVQLSHDNRFERSFSNGGAVVFNYKP